MKRYGYHRTSTAEQHLDRGIKEITAYCDQNHLELEKIFRQGGLRRVGNRVYVETVAEYSDSGVLRPLSIEWEDGTTYKIARIKHCVPTVSRS